MARLMVLEDDPSVREEVVDFLTQCGHDVDSAGSLTEFRAQSCYPDIAILDVTLPDGDGFEAALALKEQSRRTGIIMLTGRTQLHDKLRGLEVGGDHYVAKPFLLEELAAIVAALLRRMGTGWRLDQTGHRLLDPCGNALSLNAMEFLLFAQLIQLKGSVLSRESLLAEFAQQTQSLDERRLDTAICRLRARWQTATGAPFDFTMIQPS